MDKSKNALDLKLEKHDNVTTFYLASRYNKFDLFIPKPEIDYNGSMENTIVAEVAIISDDENDIDGPDQNNYDLISFGHY